MPDFKVDPDYVEVADRIAEFRANFPTGSLRPANPEHVYDIITVGDRAFVVYVAAAYRTPDDPMPGIGVAWEPFPGKTPYTRDSELQNAETSAWGRAIIASLASTSKKVASANEVRNRQEEPKTGAVHDISSSGSRRRPPPQVTSPAEAQERIAELKARLAALDDESRGWAREMAKEDGIPKLELAKPAQLERVAAIVTLAENAGLPFEETEA